MSSKVKITKLEDKLRVKDYVSIRSCKQERIRGRRALRDVVRKDMKNVTRMEIRWVERSG